MEEVQGQPAAEPTVESMAAEVARGMLQQEEGTPKDPASGKFTKAQPEPEVKAEPEAEPQAEPGSEEEPQAESPSLKFKVKYKSEEGEDVEAEVDQDELVKGYMLEKSYRQKTAQLARERESVQSKIKEAVEPRLKEYDEKLQMAEQAIWHTLAPEIQNIDWNKLATENPAEWAQKYQHVQNVNAKLAQIQAERKKISEAREQEAKVNLKKQAEEAVEVLKSEIPGWSNELYGKILKSGTEFGFRSEELNAITDPRAIKVLHLAMKYRELQAKPVVEKRAAATVPKVVKPGTAEKPDAGSEKWNEGMAKLKKSGRTEDAVAVAKLMLSREARQKQ